MSYIKSFLKTQINFSKLLKRLYFCTALKIIGPNPKVGG